MEKCSCRPEHNISSHETYIFSHRRKLERLRKFILDLNCSVHGTKAICFIYDLYITNTTVSEREKYKVGNNNYVFVHGEKRAIYNSFSKYCLRMEARRGREMKSMISVLPFIYILHTRKYLGVHRC